MRVSTLLTIGAIAAFSFSVLADDGHNNGSFDSSVVGSMPGLTIGGIMSGGAPWVVKEGEATVSANGRIRVEVQGLLIGPGGPANLVGTTGPVTMVGATLVCGGAGGAPAAVNGAVTPSPLSSSGNAEINQLVTLPSPACFAPVVLVRVFSPSAPIGSQLGPFIAVSGLMPGAAQNQNQNDHEGNDGGGNH